MRKFGQFLAIIFLAAATRRGQPAAARPTQPRP